MITLKYIDLTAACATRPFVFPFSFPSFLLPYLHPFLLLPEINLILLLVGPPEVIVVGDGGEQVLGADDAGILVLREGGREEGRKGGRKGGREEGREE